MHYFLYLKHVFQFITGVDFKLQPVICNYISPGQNGIGDPTIPTLLPQNIPEACEIILFYPVFIDTNSSIICDTGNLLIKYIYLNNINT